MMDSHWCGNDTDLMVVSVT